MSPEKPKKETPSSHPSSEGLGNAIRAGVQDELERLGIGGSGVCQEVEALEQVSSD